MLFSVTFALEPPQEMNTGKQTGSGYEATHMLLGTWQELKKSHLVRRILPHSPDQRLLSKEGLCYVTGSVLCKQKLLRVACLA